MLYVPGLYEFFDLLCVEDYYEMFCIFNMLSAVILFFYFFKRPLRTGKFYKPAKGEVLVGDRISFVASNLIPLIFFLYSGQFFLEFDGRSMPSCLFILIHLARAALAAARSRYSNPWPLQCLLYTIGYKTCIAVLAARVFVGGDYYVTPFTAVKGALMSACLIIEAMIDIDTAKLRFHGDRGYKIPTTFWFKYISGPSYLCEILFWVIWGSLFHVDFGIIAIWLWLLPAVYGRAEVTHRWYLRVFRGQYPKNRTAIIPFVDVGQLVTGVVGSMEYGW